MTPFIHHTARVHPSAILRHGCWIGPKVIIEQGAVIGHYSVIGGAPEHSKFYDDVDGESTKGVVIERDVRIFEFVTVQSGTVEPTLLAPRAAVFQHSHISHDCFLDVDTTVCGRSSLAGFVQLLNKSIVGAHAIVHQHCVVGHFAMVGMGSALKAHVGIAQSWVGYPARQVGMNDVGIERSGKTLEQLLEFYGPEFEHFKKEAKL